VRADGVAGAASAEVVTVVAAAFALISRISAAIAATGIRCLLNRRIRHLQVWPLGRSVRLWSLTIVACS
jgi:phage portal protein BeeE